MNRHAYKNLVKWKNSQHRKPLIMRGARQVGKTYLLKQFAEQEFQNYCYLNFEENDQLKDFFEGSLNPEQILKNLSLYLSKKIDPKTTLLIFDEIQECPNALTSLKYFNEQANEIAIVAAGSLLGVKLTRKKGFPVGKVNFLDLYPLSFCEFLDAMGKQTLNEYLQSINDFMPLPEPIHQQLVTLLKEYLFVGGMPEAVKRYIESSDLTIVQNIHKEILNAYLLDFAKHAPPHEIMRITTIWESIPTQLAKENKKFIFSVLRKSARAREYEGALQWLTDAGLIYKSFQVSVPRLPIDSYANQHIFKVFLFDVGLLGAMCRLAPQIILEGDALFTEFKGALTENFVAQSLKAKYDNKIYYWSSEGKAEVDFLVPIEKYIYPLEVKAGITSNNKSLRVYQQRNHPTHIARATLMNLKSDGDIHNYPLYMMEQFPLTPLSRRRERG